MLACKRKFAKSSGFFKFLNTSLVIISGNFLWSPIDGKLYIRLKCFRHTCSSEIPMHN